MHRPPWRLGQGMRRRAANTGRVDLNAAVRALVPVHHWGRAAVHGHRVVSASTRIRPLPGARGVLARRGTAGTIAAAGMADGRLAPPPPATPFLTRRPTPWPTHQPAPGPTPGRVHAAARPWYAAGVYSIGGAPIGPAAVGQTSRCCRGRG